jgi:hypothetical protein
MAEACWDDSDSLVSKGRETILKEFPKLRRADSCAMDVQCKLCHIKKREREPIPFTRAEVMCADYCAPSYRVVGARAVGRLLQALAAMDEDEFVEENFEYMALVTTPKRPSENDPTVSTFRYIKSMLAVVGGWGPVWIPVCVFYGVDFKEV